MPTDPYTQREHERAREDEADHRRTHEAALERQREKADVEAVRPHLEVLADALAAPGSRWNIGFDPADGGTMLTAPVREYRCREGHDPPIVVVVPSAVKDHNGHVVGYHYAVADGPFCIRCGRLMVRRYADPGVQS